MTIRDLQRLINEQDFMKEEHFNKVEFHRLLQNFLVDFFEVTFPDEKFHVQNPSIHQGWPAISVKYYPNLPFKDTSRAYDVVLFRLIYEYDIETQIHKAFLLAEDLTNYLSFVRGQEPTEDSILETEIEELLLEVDTDIYNRKFISQVDQYNNSLKELSHYYSTHYDVTKEDIEQALIGYFKAFKENPDTTRATEMFNIKTQNENLYHAVSTILRHVKEEVLRMILLGELDV